MVDAGKCIDEDKCSQRSELCELNEYENEEEEEKTICLYYG